MQTATEKKPVGKKAKPQVVMIELVNQKDSGFVLDGTRDTDFEQRITAPTAYFLPNTGFRLGKDEKGEFNEEIRFIKNHRELSVAKQNSLGIKPSNNKLEDKIIVKNGQASFVKEGAFSSLFDYIMDAFYNESNPNRPPEMAALYRVITPGLKEEKLNIHAFAKKDAMDFLSNYFYKQGDKYFYKEEKIDALCQMFIVYADTYAGKVNGLIAHIEHDPQGFLDKALKMEQTVLTQVTHALELGVARFEKNCFVYNNKDKVICDLGAGNLKQDKKIQKAADFLGDPENKDTYEEFRIELETAQEKQLN